MRKCILFLLFSFAVFASSITILNDSSYTLTARVYAAHGELVGEMTIQPQHQVKWQTYSLKGSRFSQTPYNITFVCPTGDEYGTVQYVQPGSYVSARSAVGDLTCKPPPKKDEDQKPPPTQQELDRKYEQKVTEEPLTP